MFQGYLRLKPRFIPAGAGNTPSRRFHRQVDAVHPRWRGEHLRLILADRTINGSSPLARGTRHRITERNQNLRFIPAGAGNTWSEPGLCRVCAVHPRWRGEHAIPCIRSASCNRFIPAGAGNTTNRAIRHMMDSVHPRWRGEHADKAALIDDYAGSSPLARGTRVRTPPR